MRMRSGVARIVVGLLDGAVRHAHRYLRGPLHPHPYHVLSDTALAAEVILAAAWCVRTGESLLTFLVAFVIMHAGYRWVWLPAKHRLMGERARSALQDVLGFLLPTYLGVTWVLGGSLAAAADLAGLALPLGLMFLRLGCFVGGCCYGRPSPVGVWYDRDTIRIVDGFRRFTPGPWPGKRVLPTQLLEAVFHAATFVVLAPPAFAATDGTTLPRFLAAYAAWRLISDPLRGHRHRPLRAGLSEAQWIGLVLLVVIIGVWGVL